jgi:hypothetical protein
MALSQKKTDLRDTNTVSLLLTLTELYYFTKAFNVLVYLQRHLMNLNVDLYI